MAHPPDIRSDNRTHACQRLDQGYRCTFVNAGQDNQVEVGQGGRDIQPPAREMDALSDTKIDGQALQMGPEFAVPQDGKVELGTLARAEKRVAWSLIGTSLPTVPASGTSLASARADRSPPGRLPGLPISSNGPRSKPRGTTWYCSWVPMRRSSNSSRTSGLTAIRAVRAPGQFPLQFYKGALLRTPEVTLEHVAMKSVDKFGPVATVRRAQGGQTP